MGEAEELRGRVRVVAAELGASRRPSREELARAAEGLAAFRAARGLPGLLGEPPPLMLTATLDDGWGNGLASIEGFARAVGLRVERLGLLLAAAEVARACREREPALLGMTVLQASSEEPLAEVVRGVPRATRVVVGGPVFQLDPELAERTGVTFVARDAAAFLDYLLGI